MIRPRSPKDALALVALGGVYFVVGKLSLQLAFVHASATAVWPCTGIALAAFLILGYRVWPVILTGAFLVNLTTAGSVATSIGIAVGNTLEGVVGCYLVSRFAGGQHAFERAQDIFKFAFLAGMVSTTVSATVGVTTLALGGFAQWTMGRYREDTIRPDGTVIRARPQVVLGTKKELPTQRLAARKLDEILSRINDYSYQPTRIATVAEFVARWRVEVLAKRKPSTVCSANSHLNSHVIPQLGKLRLDQVGPENQQIFVNQLIGASRKTVLNVLSTLSSMLTTAKDWGYASREVEIRKLVLPERNSYVAAHFTRSTVESIFSLAQDPWRTFFILLAMTGMRAGEALGLQWGDIDFDHQCIHIRRSAWYGKAQSTKSKGSAAPIALPLALSAVLTEYKVASKPNHDGYLFVTRNGRPPSSNKVVEYQLWPILDALGIPRCGLHAFRHSVASFIVDAGYPIEVAQQQLRHSNARTTLGYTHFRGGVTEQAMADVSNSLKLDAVGREQRKGSQYIQ